MTQQDIFVFLVYGAPTRFSQILTLKDQDSHSGPQDVTRRDLNRKCLHVGHPKMALKASLSEAFFFFSHCQSESYRSSQCVADKYCNSITLFSHVGRFHDLGVCQLYYAGSINKVYSCIRIDTWRLGWSYIPNTIDMNHCSSRHYSHIVHNNTITKKYQYNSQSSPYSLFVLASISSYFLSFLPWR